MPCSSAAAARRYCLPDAGIYDVGFRVAIAPSVNEPTLAGTDSNSTVFPEVPQPGTPDQWMSSGPEPADTLDPAHTAGDSDG